MSPVTTVFTYDEAWLADPRSYAISPDLDLTTARHHVTGLPRALADGAPDRWGRTSYVAGRDRSWRTAGWRVRINNTDDHLRNHGLLRSDAGWTLSPAFDLDPNPDPGVQPQTSTAFASGGREERLAEGVLDGLTS